MQSTDKSRIKLSPYEDYDHNKKYQRVISKQIKLQEYDYMFTFRCDQEICRYFDATGVPTTHSVSFEELKSLINEFFKRFNYKILGRHALRSPERWIQYLGIAENRSRHGERVELHCHTLVKATPEFEKYITDGTELSNKEGVRRVWWELARKTHGLHPQLDIQLIYDDYEIASYCTKHLWYEAAQSMLFTHRDFIGRKRLYD